MTADAYGERVRALFANPEHAGSLDDAVEARVSDQDVRIRLWAMSENGVVSALRFKAWGCPHVIAATEAFCAAYEGREAAELFDFRAGDLMQSLTVPVEKTGRILVLEDAVRALGNSLRDAERLN